MLPAAQWLSEAEGAGMMVAHPSRAGSCPILTFVRMVPTAVEG
jgi:hypothetical protein